MDRAHYRGYYSVVVACGLRPLPLVPGDTNMANLETELKTFREKLPELLAEHDGKFALVIGDKIEATFDTYSDALQAGYAKAGVGPFLVKKITSVEEVINFSRALNLCPV